LNDWQTHTGNAYACNKFEESKNENISIAKAELNRFLHFCQRYNNHYLSLGYEKKTCDIVTKAIDGFPFVSQYNAELSNIRSTLLQVILLTKENIMNTYLKHVIVIATFF